MGILKSKPEKAEPTSEYAVPSGYYYTPPSQQIYQPEDPSKAIFGVSLSSAAMRSDPEKLIPSPVRKAVAWLNAHALNEVGLYRVPGSLTKVKEYRAAFDRGESVDFPESELPENVSGTLTRYLKDIPDSVFTYKFLSEFQSAQALQGDEHFNRIRELVAQLPEQNYATLDQIIGHFHRVHTNHDVNKMTASNLSLCIYPSVIKSLTTMIERYPELFLRSATAAEDAEKEDSYPTGMSGPSTSTSAANEKRLTGRMSRRVDTSQLASQISNQA
eukprot:GFYU01003080.1.p1 GENE.GFYU01003080.1~~GFYU01003080.1.p1  ORF type:complete len:273 (-),score=41.54 GFYU01003080.1:206-1024(-)